MKKIIAKFIIAIIVTVLFGMVITSCADRSEKSGKEPMQEKLKLVSMSPNITQIVFALGLGDLLIGVDDYSVYPPEAKSIPRMGSLMKPNLELLAKSKPDLVLVVNTDENLIRMLDGIGINHAEFGHNTTGEVIDCIRRLGDILNRKARADAIIGNFNNAVNEIKAKLENEKPTSVALVVGRTPGRLEDIIFAGQGSFLDELISLSGGVNIFSDAKIRWPQAG
ncbi:MAG: helical backbone metal receptor, partial [bacterium]